MLVTLPRKGGNMKILVVEDNRFWQARLIQWLTQLGHTVVATAYDQSSALKATEENVPELVTMDGKLIGEKGLDIARAIRELYPNIQILMISGEGDEFEGKGLCKEEFRFEQLGEYIMRNFK